jgi:hypothetical protein
MSDNGLLPIVLLLLAAAAPPPRPQPFAIRCTGDAAFTDNMSGRPNTRRYDLPPQIYVLDEVGQNVRRALEPRQEFEEICFRGGEVDSRSFSQGLIVVHSEAPGRFCDFTVNRATGGGEYVAHEDLPAGRFSRIEFDMTCEATEIPVFDSSRNRF